MFSIRSRWRPLTALLFIGSVAAIAVGRWGCGGEASLSDGSRTAALESTTCQRVITADVVALDQVYSYNRFGSYNPVGMVYALRRDVVAIDPVKPLGPGNVRLRPDKRPRPLVLRVNAGDCLQYTFTNWLAPTRRDIPSPQGDAFRASDLDLREDAPATRVASLHIQGVEYLGISADGANVGHNPSSLVAPGQSISATVYAPKEGTFLIRSMGAITGGEGLGGSTVHGLFGALNVEPAGSVWYRSQVTHEDLVAATRGRNPDGTPLLDYAAVGIGGVPVLRILDDRNEIVHSDLTAIIARYPSTDGVPSAHDEGAFREVTAIFHDELKAVQAFGELETDPQFHGVRDGFGINYGASGLGSILLANRKNIGPSADCIECKFEEFFLTSWANGDPALNVTVDEEGRANRALFPDDPSNVYHAYLGDPLRIRNLHAGPKEQHVFHLHGHQWLQTPEDDRSTYLDSQTLGPGSAFTYEINYGGGGNRNLTPGDAIFHCHLYPHFAQGMWALWRNHDVFEAGTPDRSLPDAEIAQGTPTPAVVPLPDRALPPMPTWTTTQVEVDGRAVDRPPMPGYPHYLAARPGHRPPQAPLDLVFNGGLPRHLVLGAPEEGSEPAVELGRRGEFDSELLRADIKLLPDDGTPLERAAMDFHAGAFPGAVDVTTEYGWEARAYPAFDASGSPTLFTVNGQPAAAGAPLADPCPTDAPLRRYRASYLQVDAVANRAGWHDPQTRLMVLDDDVADTLSGRREPEPFFFRANSGDCIEFQATNLIPDVLQEDDFQIFTPTDTIGQHIHLVKFDLLASDGAANGWNYEDGTFAAEEVRARIEAANQAGGAFPADGELERSGVRTQLAAQPHPRLPLAPLGAQTTVQRWWADPLVDRLGQDRTVTTVFTHDHFSPSSHQQHGLYGGLLIEPHGSTWRDPQTGILMGTREDGGPTSWRADILAGEGGANSHREFALAVSDFALLYDNRGRPVNPPTFKETRLPLAVEHENVRRPEVVTAGDPGGMLLNYRNEPLPLRLARRDSSLGWVQRAGEAGETHNLFRSTVHGDPFTPLLRGYPGDPVTLRLIGGAQEELHVFAVNGHRWRSEAADGDSGYTAAQPLSVSEHFEFELAEGLPPILNPHLSADFLYRSASSDDLWNGLWGLMRAYRDQQPDLLPLPNNPLDGRTSNTVCPAGAPRRSYTVRAMLARDLLPGGRLVYNSRFGLHDPDALLFVREEHVEGLRAGTRKPEPLILRAAAGECIDVMVINDLPETLPQTPGWNYLPPIVEHFNTNQVRTSNHVSLHPTLLTYDVMQSDGTTAGFNPVQSIPPGATMQYTWFAGRYRIGSRGKNRREAEPIEFGVIPLRDDADVVHRGMQGAIGALVVEPRGATWVADPGTEAQATVTYVQDGITRTFREFVVVVQDEVALHSDLARFQCADSSLNCGTAIRNLGGADDAEDTGHVAVNYRTEPLWARVGIRPEDVDDHAIGLNSVDQRDLLSSAVHGDPETPVFTASVGQPLRLRVVVPSSHARLHSFEVHGMAWPRNPWGLSSDSRWMGDNPDTGAVGAVSAVSALTSWNIVPYSPAGGRFGVQGDYLWFDPPSTRFVDGSWGLLRVGPPPSPPQEPSKPSKGGGNGNGKGNKR